MPGKRATLAAVLLVVLSTLVAFGQENYSDSEAVAARLRELQNQHPQLIELFSIGKSAGGKDIPVARIAAKGAVDPDARPALFIGADIEGVRLPATEAALEALRYLAEHAADEGIAGLLESRTFYIAPLLNPDVTDLVFSEPGSERTANLKPVNDDRDLATDEDGPEDINGDGFISRMRFKAVDGDQVADPDDPRFMRKADPIKGEVGEYKLLTEGLDNDGDGEYNEDPPGGVELNRNFPHDYSHFRDGTGPYPVSEVEAVALLEFLVGHRNIAVIFVFGAKNNLLNLQRGKGPAEMGAEKVKVPERMAGFVGLDPEKEYTIKEIVELVKDLPFVRQAGIEVNEALVANFLGLGPVMSIPDQDYKYFEEVSKRYKAMLEDKKIDDPKRGAAADIGDGSFATYAYFHYGVPAFTVDLWAVPEPKEEKKEGEGSGITVEKLKEMTSEEFLALGEEKIALFLEEQKAPDNIKPSMVMQGLRSGMITPARMAEMIAQRGGGPRQEGKGAQSYILKWAEDNVPGGGFIPWTPFEHPTLGAVEIGGMKPYVTINPPLESARGVLEPNAVFAVKLAELLPSIEIVDLKAVPLDANLYEVSAFVRNNGFFPTALQQGVTTRAVPPVILKIDVAQKDLLSGSAVNRINSIPGNGISGKFHWVVRANRGAEITLSAHSVKSGSDVKKLELR